MPLHHLLTAVLLLGGLMLSFGCTPTGEGGGAGVKVYGTPVLVSAESGTGTLVATTTLPAGALAVGSRVSIASRAYGAGYYDPETFVQENTAMALSIDGHLVINDGWVGDESSPTSAAWEGMVVSATELEWLSVRPSASSTNVPDIDITGDIVVQVQISGGGDGPRGVLQPVVTVYPPAEDTGA